MKRAEITLKKNAIKNNAFKSFEATIVNNYDPLIQLANTRGILREKLETLVVDNGHFNPCFGIGWIGAYG